MLVPVTIRHSFDVELVDHMGDDHRPLQAARTSTLGPESLDTGQGPGLTNRLIGDRHGVPFEHAVMSWLITAPIAVWREFMRHRMASYSEESARYRQLAPNFYIPPLGRLLLQTGKPMDYKFEPAEITQYGKMHSQMTYSYEIAYQAYLDMLAEDIAREVARLVLPVGIYSTAMVTMNLRALMNFLSLRVKAEGSMFPTNPQWEINQVANEMENQFAELFPIIHEKFVSNGRVCP